MDKGLLPSTLQDPKGTHGLPITRGRLGKRGTSWRALLVALLVFVVVHNAISYLWSNLSTESTNVPLNAEEILDKCRLLDVKPGPPPDFNLRKQSDRFVEGTKATIIKNATIWTGRLNGLEVLTGDILLDNGLIIAVGDIQHELSKLSAEVVTIDANGAWVSPGIVDLHSHLAVDSAPALKGSNDGNSRKGPILPWLRAFDALNTHDDAYRLSISGGVTTALVLPGSANAIGGQGAVIKLRPTRERSPTSMLLENPYSINRTEYDPSLGFRWRQIKHACGENPDRVYSQTRMDTTWAFRQAYDKARQIKRAQDQYCAKAQSGQWNDLGEFSEDLQWEALVDVLRGRVKVHAHCYETVDLDDLVRTTNEFEFSIAAFHHAHETYLVPETLKAAYGHPPAAALFATSARYKRESYRGSEFAPKILADNGLQVVMKSDHPVLNSRFLLFEAQQAHYYGLAHNLALVSVTTTPAQVMGMDHRIGYVKQGFDADLVIWDSHPLALGATPKQVWIDGIAQIEFPYSIDKPSSSQHVPLTPSFGKEAEETLKYDGLPPLAIEHTTAGSVVFANISSMWAREDHEVLEVFTADSDVNVQVAVMKEGRIVCFGKLETCSQSFINPDTKWVDLQGGALVPALTSFGSPLGLGEIRSEPSTIDGYVLDPLSSDAPSILGGDRSIIRAADGLQYAGRDALLAYRSGVTTGVVAPRFVSGTTGFLAGLSTAFASGAEHKLEKGAVIQNVVAFHVAISRRGTPSVSTQVAALRQLLTSDEGHGELDHWVRQVKEGSIPLVIDVESADTMASLIELKKEVESNLGHSIKVTFTGASEAHLLAQDIGAAGIGIIITSSRPFPASWEARRILPGPPLTEENAISVLLANNVTVGIGVKESAFARNARFDAAWVALESGDKISRTAAHSLASVNLEKLLGLAVNDRDADMIATRGGDLFSFSKVVGIISPRRGVIDLL